MLGAPVARLQGGLNNFAPAALGFLWLEYLRFSSRLTALGSFIGNSETVCEIHASRLGVLKNLVVTFNDMADFVRAGGRRSSRNH